MNLEDEFYEIVADEISSKNLVKSTYTRAFAESDGDKSKTQARYIKLRVAQLREDFEDRLEKAETDAKQKSISKSEQRRREALIDNRENNFRVWEKDEGEENRKIRQIVFCILIVIVLVIVWFLVKLA